MAAKAARPRSTPVRTASDASVPAVGARQPCPCGSGRRYKACHGRQAARAVDHLVSRPFAGLRGECDWVALREIVPAATAPLHLSAAGEHVERSATLATVLPMAWPALVRVDGAVFVGLQVPGGSGDPSRDAAAALLRALAAEPGTPLAADGLPGPGPRLQDVLDPDAGLEVTVHAGFDFWLDGVVGAGEADSAGGAVSQGGAVADPEIAASMERANSAVVPTVRLTSVEAAYWAQLRGRCSLRWVLPHDEEPLLDAMARLHAADADRLLPDSRYIGSFRAHGLLVPVWDLPDGTRPDVVEEPAAAYAERLGEALAERRPLTDAERRARSGLLSRQVTLRQ